MAVFEEKRIWPWAAPVLLALLFLLTFPPWHLADRELFWNEGEYAVAVEEMSSIPPVVTGHGHLLSSTFPLFLLPVKAAVSRGMPMEFALRFFSVLTYFFLTALVFFICRRNTGLQAACAAAAVMFATVIACEKVPEGYPTVLTALLLYGGWMSWIETGLGRGNWSRAWILAGLFGGLIFYNAGFTGLIYFLVPLAMQRRPLTVWPKIKGAGFYFGALLVLLFILFWWVPRWGFPPDPSADWFAGFSPGEYLRNLAVFPFNSFLRLLPWSLLLWAPFCAALIPLEKNPLFGKFHRILFLTLLLLIWFNPASKGRDLIYLLPLMATMIGTNYWIVARRYGTRISRICTLCAWIVIPAALAAAAYLALAPETLESLLAHAGIRLDHPLAYKQAPAVLFLGYAECAGALICGLSALFLIRKKFPLWLTASLLVCGWFLLDRAAVSPYRAQDRSKHEFAAQLKTALENDGFPAAAGNTVYSNVNGLFAEGYYSGFRFRYLEPENLPKEEKTVYIITAKRERKQDSGDTAETPDVFPTNPDRIFRRVRDMKYRDYRLFLYKGRQIGEEEYDTEEK